MLFGFLKNNKLTQKDKQKLVLFENKDIINNVTNEETEKSGVSVSNIIEECTLKSCFTEEVGIAKILMRLYAKEYSTSDALENIFCVMASGKTRIQKKSNLSIFLTAMELAENKKPKFAGRKFIGEYMESYFLVQFSCILDALTHKKNEYLKTEEFKRQLWKHKDIEKSIYLNIDIIPGTLEKRIKEIEQLISYGSAIYARYDGNFKENLSFLEMYRFILDTWEYVYDTNCVYKIGMELQKLQNTDTCEEEEKRKIRAAVVKASREWDKIEEE